MIIKENKGNSFENQKRERKSIKKNTKQNENQNNQLKNLKEFAFAILSVCVVLNNTFEVICFQIETFSS